MKREPRYKKGDLIGGRFLVHEALMGGMGEVYLGYDSGHGVVPLISIYRKSSQVQN